MLSSQNQLFQLPPPSPTQAMNNDRSPTYDNSSGYEAVITKKMKQIVNFENCY